MENQFTQEYIKHKFTEDEKREIAIEMAQKVSELQRTEGSIKAIKSDYKSRIDGVQANINHAATKLNNGYEMRNLLSVRSFLIGTRRYGSI
jgi:hypothetical protein